MLSLTDGMQLVMKEQYLRLVAPRRMASDAVIETRNAAKEQSLTKALEVIAP